jgi:hypothetical protein
MSEMGSPFDPRRGDDRERLLYALDEDDRGAGIVYQMTLARVDVEDVAGPAELLAGGLVLKTGVVGVRIVGPEYPRRLAIRAGNLIENAGSTFFLAFGETTGKLTAARDRVDSAAVQDVGRDCRAYLVCLAV